MVSSTTELVTGDGRVITINEVSKLYREGLSLASPSAGRIQRLGDEFYSLTSVSNTVDCDTLETIKTFKVYSLQTSTKPSVGRCIESVRCISDAHRLVDYALATSENGRFLARLKAPSKDGGSSSSGAKKQQLELWDRSRLVKTIDISEVENHGPINTDAHFGSIQWSPFGEQDKLLFVCQPKQPKPISFFKANNKPGQSGDCGQEYMHKGDWGECFTGVEHTLIGIIDMANECQITTIDMKGYSLAESRWIDNGDKIISVAYKEDPRRLGLIFCNNKPSNIVIHDWRKSNEANDQLSKIISSDTNCYHNVRVSHKGDKFVYLTNPVYGAHRHSVRLHLYDLNTNEDKELVDKTTGEADLFIDGLPGNCFSKDDKNLLFTVKDHLYNHMCLYNIDDNQLSRIKFPTIGLSIQDFRYDIILASGSEVNSTPTLFVATLSNSKNAGELVAWHQMEECIHLEEVDYEPHKIPTADGSSFVSAILVSPNLTVLNKRFASPGSITDHSQLPTVVIVHGGPHSSFTLYHMPIVVFYARLGLKSLLINYRGSDGVSEDYLSSLHGKIGRMDVDDCLHAIRHFVRNKTIDPSKLMIYGGSHGGFLSCHLTCQDEFKFTSATIKNPVTSLSTMYEMSDIPEWIYTEGLGHQQYDPSWRPSGDDLKRLDDMSPISKSDKVNVPTLMMLGTQDKRVPMYQGMRWVDLLRARGVETMCKIYADKHDLKKTETEADSHMTEIVWMLTHLKSS